MLGKQAKVLSKQQVDLVYSMLGLSRNPERNRVVFLLSSKAGLRAKEIANLTWSMVLTADGTLSDQILLENSASKGSSGRCIPLNSQLKQHLQALLNKSKVRKNAADLQSLQVVQSERSNRTSPQVIVNMFKGWYKQAGLMGCSSHSGRRTFITNAARKISTVGGSLRDVQWLAGHSSLQTTQRYIDSDSEAMRKVVNLV